MKQKLIKCCACGKEEMRGPCAKYCSSCSEEIKSTSFHKRNQKRNEMVALIKSGSEESFAADNAYKVFQREAREKQHDDFAKESPMVYYTVDDSTRPFERRVFIRWYRGLSIKSTAQELDCPEKRVANCLHALGCQANNGKRPAGLWELVETETGLRVRPKEVQWTLDV